MNRRIVLLTPAHPASNPRLVKEAAALHAAGYEVTVVCGRYYPVLDALDATLLPAAPWRAIRVDYTPRAANLWPRLLRCAARRWIAAARRANLAMARVAQHSAVPALARAAARVPADLYIGHCLPGLAAADLAARKNGAHLGFDAEDYHPAETVAAATDPVEILTIDRLEYTLLPRCRHLTAASPLIADAYTIRLGLTRPPVTVLNAFPLADAPSEPRAPERARGRPCLYWFSQTIGPGRGLEELLPVLARMRIPCDLHLRGQVASAYAAELAGRGRAAGFHGDIVMLPSAPPSEMVRLAATADLGLSLEQPSPRNRDLCLTNKIFAYLLAGVPQLMTATSAQQAFADEIGEAGLLLTGNIERDSAMLDLYLTEDARQARARLRAWDIGRQRYNWEQEQTRFLSSVKDALA